MMNAATASRDIINTLMDASGRPANDIHAQWTTLLAVLTFPHTARGLRTPPPPEKPDAPPAPTSVPATMTLALLRAMGHLWDTLVVDDRPAPTRQPLDHHSGAQHHQPGQRLEAGGTTGSTADTTAATDDGDDDGN